METLYMDACGDTQMPVGIHRCLWGYTDACGDYTNNTQMPIQSEEDQQEKSFKAGKKKVDLLIIRKGTHKTGSFNQMNYV